MSQVYNFVAEAFRLGACRLGFDLQGVRTRSGLNPFPCHVGTTVTFSWIKTAVDKTYRSLLSCAESKDA